MLAALQVFSIMMAILVPVAFLLFALSYIKNKQITNDQLAELKKELNENSTGDLEKEITELKERIVVLESIVTDRQYNLERKISNL